VKHPFLDFFEIEIILNIVPRIARSVTNNQDLKKLSSLIKTAINISGKTDSEVAEEAGIARSHLYYVLKGEKSLSEDKLRKLADKLNFPESALLQAAGFIESTSVIDDALADFSAVEAITVITDPHFLDSALFLWLFESRFLNSFGIKWNFKKTIWSMVPMDVDETQHSIGFFNRKSKVIFRGKTYASPKYWSDLCVYKGYSLIARRENVPWKKKVPDIREVEKYLNDLTQRSSGRPMIVTMASGTVKQFDNPFVKAEWDKFKIEVLPNPDIALSMFLKGYGDLFIGGLPQRFKAEKEGDCISLISAANNPALFSMNSLICSRGMYDQGRAIMSVITSVWFQVCDKLREDRDFRTKVFYELDDMLKTKFEIFDHSITMDLFDAVFDNQLENNYFEFFPRRPAGIVSQTIKILDECVQQGIKLKFSAAEIGAAIEWIMQNKIDPGRLIHPQDIQGSK
jgi:transcriptional regulator with XRE-family HTH domain